MGPAKGEGLVFGFGHKLRLVKDEIISRVAAGHVNFSAAVTIKVARCYADVAQVNPWA